MNELRDADEDEEKDALAAVETYAKTHKVESKVSSARWEPESGADLTLRSTVPRPIPSSSTDWTKL